MRNKIGFHTGPGGNPTGIGDWMRAHDVAGIPFCLKSVDHYGPVFEAQELMKKSNVAHVLIFRLSSRGQGDYDYDVPPYKDPKYVDDPEGGAELHWSKTIAKLPPEFDKERVWLEVINEVDRNLCDWLGRFAVRIAELAERDGYKVSLFAWSAGEPEPSCWETSGMLAYLRKCAQKPQQFAVALHEYAYVEDDIFHDFPFKIGRFQYLFATCDKHGIARPTVHVTEWGWTLNSVPEPAQAIAHVTAVGELYAPYPSIEGLAIWYLGDEFGGIADKAQRLIQPMTDFGLNYSFEVDTLNPTIPTLPAIEGWEQGEAQPPVEPPMEPPEGGSMTTRPQVFDLGQMKGILLLEVIYRQWNPELLKQDFIGKVELTPPEGVTNIRVRATLPDEGGSSVPPVQYDRVFHVYPTNATPERLAEIFAIVSEAKQSAVFSHDDAGYAPNQNSNTVILWDVPEGEREGLIAYYAENYPETAVEFRGNSNPDFFSFAFWPTEFKHVTQPFGVNPQNYAQFGLPGHEGVDIRASHGSKVFAVRAGTVAAVGDDRVKKADGGHNYGVRIYIDHEDGWQTVYAHLDARHVNAGDFVEAGQWIGNADNTGNSFGSHLHLTLKRPGFSYTDSTGSVWPLSIFDPTPAMSSFDYTVEGQPTTPAPQPAQYTGPEVSTFISGIDQPASDWYWFSGKAVYENTGLSPKFHTGGVNHEWWAVFKNPVFNLVRVLLDPSFNGGAQDIFNETTNNVAQFYNQGARDFELLNEPNIEGMGIRWNNGREFGEVFRELCKIFKGAYPEIRLWFPGMSPGFGAQHTYIADAASVGAFDHVYGVCEHVYTGIADNAAAAASQMIAEVKDFQQRWALTQPLCITEFSVNRPATAEHKAAVYHQFYDGLANIPGIQAAYSFTSTWHPSGDENQEGWLEWGIDKAFTS